MLIYNLVQLKLTKFGEGTMKLKKGTKDVSHKEHEGHQDH